MARKKKDDDDIEKLVDNAFDKGAEKLIESMEATNQITEETEKIDILIQYIYNKIYM